MTGASATYPTWVKIQPGRYESEEQMGGTPDFVAQRYADSWHVKWRSSEQTTSGFSTIGEVKAHVASLVEGMTNRTLSRRDRMGA